MCGPEVQLDWPQVTPVLPFKHYFFLDFLILAALTIISGQKFSLWPIALFKSHIKKNLYLLKNAGPWASFQQAEPPFMPTRPPAQAAAFPALLARLAAPNLCLGSFLQLLEHHTLWLPPHSLCFPSSNLC